MEKITTTTETITKNVHEFYCDECEVLIGTSEEYLNGGYERLGVYELNVLTPDGLFKYYDKCLCDACKAGFPTKVAEALEAIGCVYRSET
ncbi:MAG: hypothetical protein UH850_11315 [Paludibacteraceae bacterium]|nr:hypothetical protein [Paludibacteraceae bacterium]